MGPQKLQHTIPWPSLLPGVCSSSCPCYLTIWSSAVPFSSCSHSLPASGSFPMSWLFTWHGQSIGTPASVLPVNIQECFSLGWTGLISMHSKLLSRVFSSTTVQKHEFFGVQPSLWLNFHICTWLLENHSFDFMDLCQQSDVSAFCCSVWVCHSFPYKEQVSFNFMAAVTIHGDFGAQENSILFLFHCLFKSLLISIT